MSITSQITRIQSNIENAYTALEAKGATLPLIENSANLVDTINTISGGSPIESINIYTLELLREVEDDIYRSSLSKAGLTCEDILHIDDTLSPLRNDWTYKSGSVEEYFRDILTSEHVYAEFKLREILGEVNE